MIFPVKYISVTNRIRKERVKCYMGNPKGLLQVLLERILCKHLRMYVPITNYMYERIMMVIQLLRQV